MEKAGKMEILREEKSVEFPSFCRVPLSSAGFACFVACTEHMTNRRYRQRANSSPASNFAFKAQFFHEIWWASAAGSFGLGRVEKSSLAIRDL